MKRTFFLFVLLCCHLATEAQKLPRSSSVIHALERANGYFMEKHANPTQPIAADKEYPSHIWTRSVYHEGLMELNAVAPKREYIEYVTEWASHHQWNFCGGRTTHNADDYCCAQTYIELYRLHPNDTLLENTRLLLDNMVNSPKKDDWTWIDAIQMGMPVFAKYGCVSKDMRYFRKMMDLYSYTRNCINNIGLFNSMDGLWWRDRTFMPPYKEPNGENCYWSRGNGWVYAALARTITEIDRVLPDMTADEQTELKTMRKCLRDDFVRMSMALLKCQRSDGFWNCSLHDASNNGGKETTGTALFCYGMAWGIRHGLLSPAVFTAPAALAWNGMCKEALHKNGFLGYVQGTGKEPKDGQPVTYDSEPDFDDFGLGCFLLAGTEMYRLCN